MILLNINREQPSNFFDLISEATEIIRNIDDLTRTVDFSDPETPKMMVLKNRLKDLMELVSNIGDFQDVQASTKQDKIMDIQNNILILTNRIYGLSKEIDMMLSIITNFLLYHLCTTAAATPHSQVIGVANVLAQVLSSEQSQMELSLDISHDLPPSQFFSLFSLNFNYLLTNAGLFSSPIIGLPHISISALGGWAETALNFFSQLNEFIDRFFSVKDFLSYDKLFDSVVQFDSLKDILSSYLYSNEFYSSLASLADLLSGLSFPKHLLDTDEDIIFSSKEQITETLAKAIERNHERIEGTINTIYALYDQGLINRNENPYNDEGINQIKRESRIWLLVAKMGMTIKTLLELESKFFAENPEIGLREYISQTAPQHREELFSQFLELEKQFLNLMDSQDRDEILASSSRFVQYRHFFQYLLYLASSLYIFYSDDELITKMNREYYFLFQPPNSEKNPIGTIIMGQIMAFIGIEKENRSLVQEGIEILKQILPVIQFQTHHYIHVLILSEMLEGFVNSWDHTQIAVKLRKKISELLEGQFLNQESKLYQKLIIFSGLLEIYEESGVFMTNPGERILPFDIFTWLSTPTIIQSIPFLPLNTALDNLDEG